MQFRLNSIAIGFLLFRHCNIGLDQVSAACPLLMRETCLWIPVQLIREAKEYFVYFNIVHYLNNVYVCEAYTPSIIVHSSQIMPYNDNVVSVIFLFGKRICCVQYWSIYKIQEFFNWDVRTSSELEFEHNSTDTNCRRHNFQDLPLNRKLHKIYKKTEVK